MTQMTMQDQARMVATALRERFALEQDRFNRLYIDEPIHLAISRVAADIALGMFPDSAEKRGNFFQYVIGETNDYNC